MDKYIKINNEHVDKIIRSELWMYDTTELKEMLKYFPTEDVAPIVHAHWELVGHKYGSYDSYEHRCSRCHRSVFTSSSVKIENINAVYPYCHCGAKMDEGEN